MPECRDFKIITDSTTDLTPKLVEELDVHVIPMEFVFGDEVYHNYPDDREMSSEEFFNRLKNGEMPKTNQINTLLFWRPLNLIWSRAWMCSISGFLPPFPEPSCGLRKP